MYVMIIVPHVAVHTSGLYVRICWPVGSAWSYLQRLARLAIPNPPEPRTASLGQYADLPHAQVL